MAALTFHPPTVAYVASLRAYLAAGDGEWAVLATEANQAAGLCHALKDVAGMHQAQVRMRMGGEWEVNGFVMR